MKNRVAIPKSIREQVLSEFRHRCAICGADRPHLHHIDENPDNNDLLNIIPLCPNCHLTDQHNPTAPIHPGRLTLFRRYKDPVILSPQFEPLFQRLLFLDAISDQQTKELKQAAQELVDFVSSLEMGTFYGKRLDELLVKPGRWVLSSGDTEGRIQERWRNYRESLRRSRDDVHSLTVQMRVLNTDEEKLYLMAASQPLQDIATLMLETGMRPEEICRIRRENVHLDQGYLFNPYGKTKAARRKVPLSIVASNVLLKRIQNEKIKGDYLFPGRATDAPIVKVNAAHTSAVKRSKIKYCRLYDLRHTWATRMTHAGVDLVTLAAMLGHSKINMVMRYAHPTEEHQFAAVEKRLRYMAARAGK
jgi:integrase